MQKIDGGFVLLSKEALSSLNAQISSRLISLGEARGIFAQVEMRSVREAARASNAKKLNRLERIPEYTSKELSKLSGLTLKVSSKIFRKGMTHEIFQKQKGSLIPIPRRLIKFLARCTKRATVLTLLGYLERGLTLHGGVIKSAGTVKASFIARHSGLTLRSVRSARANLLLLKIITPDTTKYQRKLNRDGAYFTINLSWEDPSRPKTISASKRKISPLPIQNCTKISPPYREIKPSPKGELRNQKTQSRASNSSGVFTKREGEGRVLSKPNLKNVVKQDLYEFSRCRDLYHQACESKIIVRSEANYLNFIAAAVKAKSVKEGDPQKIFMGIIKKNLWMNITQEHEDRARMAIKQYEK